MMDASDTEVARPPPRKTRQVACAVPHGTAERRPRMGLVCLVFLILQSRQLDTKLGVVS